MPLFVSVRKIGVEPIFFAIGEGEGNGGAFQATLAIALLFFGGILTTVFGVITALSAYLHRNAHSGHGFLCLVWFGFRLFWVCPQ